MTRRPQIAVIGAGPAGLAAAVEARATGCDVTVVDENNRLGGQYFRSRQSSKAVGSPRWFRDHGQGISVWTSGVPVDAPAANRLDVWVEGDGLRTLSYDGMVLATGAYDRPIALPGWTLPGVMTAGGALSLAELDGVVAGRRAIVAGSGPFLLAVAAAIAHRGGSVTVIEASRFGASVRATPSLARDPELVRQTASYLGRLAVGRARIRYGQIVTAIQGTDRVQRVVVARADGDWSPIPGSEETLAADLVCLGYGFVPQIDLALQLGCEVTFRPDQATFVVSVDDVGRTSLARVFAAGENTGVGGARMAVVAGQIAGRTLASEVLETDPSRVQPRLMVLDRRRRRLRPVADWIIREFTPRKGIFSLAQADTIVCRCEDVTLTGVTQAIEAGASTPLAVKTATRAGMGRCQGRICMPYLAMFLEGQGAYTPTSAREVWSARPPFRPVSLGDWPVRPASSK